MNPFLKRAKAINGCNGALAIGFCQTRFGGMAYDKDGSGAGACKTCGYFKAVAEADTEIKQRKQVKKNEDSGHCPLLCCTKTDDGFCLIELEDYRPD